MAACGRGNFSPASNLDQVYTSSRDVVQSGKGAEVQSQTSNLKLPAKLILHLTWSPSLHTPALGGPGKESRELFALAPNEPEELCGPQGVHVPAKKGFEAPTNVGAGPRTQPVPFRRDPVVAERSQHQCGEFIAFRATRRVEREISKSRTFDIVAEQEYDFFLFNF